MDTTTAQVWRARLAIEDMSCEHCVAAVRAALAGVAGLNVLSVAVGSAEVESAGNVDVAPAIAAIDKVGFAAKAVEVVPIGSPVNERRGCGGGGCGCGRRA